MRTLDPGDPRALAEAALRLLDRPDGALAHAPGRVNLIGEHTDYNGGLCLPVALPHATWAAVAPRTDGVVTLRSDAADDWQGTVAGLGSAEGWAAYAGGVLWALGEEGLQVAGADVAVTSSVPLGAGLSSSAALTCAVALATLGALGTTLPVARVRAACMRAEQEVAGAPTGGMDQTVALHAEPDHALLLDFGDGSRRAVPFVPESAGLELVVVDTGVRHALADGGYADRRAACDRAVALLGVGSLSQARPEQVAGLADPTLRARARHVLTENRRVEESAAALGAEDWHRLGELMTASHRSLRDDFEVSCPELDAAVEAAVSGGALGARMTGGGFGGSAVALVPADRVPEVAGRVDRAFADQGLARPAYLRVGRGAGAAATLARRT